MVVIVQGFGRSKASFSRWLKTPSALQLLWWRPVNDFFDVVTAAARSPGFSAANV
jgi:hypothetical protein